MERSGQVRSGHNLLANCYEVHHREKSAESESITIKVSDLDLHSVAVTVLGANYSEKTFKLKKKIK